MQANIITKSRVCFIDKDRAYIQEKATQNSLSASQSITLTLGEYLCLSAKIYPPQIFQQNIKNKVIKEKASYYYETWCDLLTALLIKDEIIQIKDEAIIIIQVSSQYLNYISSCKLFRQIKQKCQNVKDKIARDIFKLQKYPQFQGKRKEIVIINLSQSVNYVDKNTTKIHIQGLYAGIFYRKGDKWRSYKILRQQIPTLQELLSVDVIMISGSSTTVLKMHPYIVQFKDILFQALQINKKLKVAGFCFGHQLISQAMGAKVQRLELAYGLQVFYPKKSHKLGSIPFLNSMGNGQNFKLKLYGYHSDHVVSVPQSLICLGSSASCDYQIFISKDKRILTFQFHPQYMYEYILTMRKRWSGSNDWQPQYTPQDIQHLKSCQIIRKTIRAFIQYERVQ